MHEKDFKKRSMILGPSLELDTDKERFSCNHAAEANALVMGDYSEPLVIPENL